MSEVQEASHVSELAVLNRRIAEFEAQRARLSEQVSQASRAVASARLIHAYRTAQKSLRAPARTFELWPLGVMLVGPLLTGAFAFVAFYILAGSLTAAFTCFSLVAALTAGILACLLFMPNAATLEALAGDSSLRLRDARTRADGARIELSNVEHALRSDKQSRDSILKSVQYQRELLLQENWKAMRGPEWEAFLVKVFHLLGGRVEPTGKSGDQGVDLIVELASRRYAVQAKGYVSSVGNEAIQQAVAGIAHYRCNCSAVITNSRFTAGAVALAESNCCLLIGEDQIPALVLGRLPL